MISYFLGDSTVCWSFGDTIDKDLNKKVLYLYKALKSSDLKNKLGIFDIVPSFKAIAVYFDVLESDPIQIKDAIDKFFEIELQKYNPNTTEADRKVVEIPVIYDGEDIDRVGRLNNLTAEEVITLHSEAEYQVAMIGFKPHFPYLIGLNPQLETPRLDSPRTSIPAGSVAIGGAQTGIYPMQSPGGWNLIGKTDPSLLKQLKPGDIISFKRSEKNNDY